MKEQYRRLMQGFVESRPKDPEPDDLLEAVRGLPEVGQLPPPWVTWTLVRLVDRLGSESTETINSWERDATSGAGSREQGTDDARPDPGYPLFEIDQDHEWEQHTGHGYSFYHNARNPWESPRSPWDSWSLDPIDEWKTDRLPFVFVPEFLGGFSYVYSLDWRHGGKGIESRCIEPSTATAELGVAELEAAGLVERVLIREGSFGHSLTPAALEHAASIAAFSGGWYTHHDNLISGGWPPRRETFWRHATPTKKVWLAAAIGDWPAAHAAALDMELPYLTPCPELIAFTRERAGRCRALRDADASARGRVCDIATAVLRNNYPSQAHQFSEEFWEAIRSAPPPPDRKIRTDEAGDDVPWPPGVRRLLDQALPLGRMPRWRIEAWCDGVTPGQKREIIRVFARDETMLADAAYRAFSDAPEQVLTLVRRGLRSPSVRSRIYTAALLGAIDEKWSRQELWQALQEPADPKETVRLRAALRYSRDRDTVRAVEAWERRHGLLNPPREEVFSNEERTVRHRVERYRTLIGLSTDPHHYRRFRNRG